MEFSVHWLELEADVWPKRMRKGGKGLAKGQYQALLKALLMRESSGLMAPPLTLGVKGIMPAFRILNPT